PLRRTHNVHPSDPALIEMLDESVRPPEEISHDVPPGRRADIRLFVSANARRQPRLTRRRYEDKLKI
ncbi:hypothetical protein, partial [Mycobacterium marinum]|uniref:hypothetical protein n=1 Tax=Mycobacterium marinum TaxID=1781 RepID=UPI0035622799